VHYGDVDLTTSVEGNSDEDCQSNNENGKENHVKAENDDDDAHRNENRLEIIRDQANRDEGAPPINDQQISHNCEKEQNSKNDDNDDCSKDSQDTDMHSESCWTENSDYIVIHHDWHINETCKFVRRQLKSHAIYLDLKDNIWKTKHVPNGDSSLKINDDHATSSSSLSQHCTTEISYEGLIGRRYYTKSTIGMNNNTILHMAIQEDSTDIAMDIIRIEHSTFLYYSVHCTDRFDCSLQSSTLLETTNTMGLTPLSLAAQKGNTTIVRELLRCGVSMSFSPADHYTGSALMQAVHFKQQKVLECIIEHYLEKYPKKPLTELLESTNVNGTTPLMRAAQEGNVSAAELLLEHGASVNCENKSGMTPLMFAAQRGHSDVCRLLIAYGANTNAQTKENESTALLLACKRGHTAVVKELVTRCELSLKNKKLETARQIIQKRIERRQAALRAHQRRDQIERNSSNGVSSRNDEKILLLLNPQTQVHLIQLEIREARHFAMICIHTLLHQNRALIKLNDGSLADVNSVESMMQSSKLPHPLHQELQNALNRPCTQMLIRSMMLPAPLMAMISSFLPLTNLWEERIEQLRDDYPRFTNSEDKVVYALDIIDEILEEGGFLLACDKVQIPAPTPYQSWCDWKRHAKAQAAWSDEDCENGVLSFDYSTSRLNLESIDVMTSFPPSPQDANNPTICEFRRLVGYSSLLAQYQSTTDIVPTLMAEPYHIPRLLIDKFIRIADLSSLCRRCCTEQCLPYSLSVHGNYDVSFSSTAASSVLDLASEFHKWYNEQNK
jgi:ankyrin repeat protein